MIMMMMTTPRSVIVNPKDAHVAAALDNKYFI